MWIVPWNPYLVKKLLKSGICGSINSTVMHCLLRKGQHLRLLFNEQYMNSDRITPKRVKKKKEQKRSLWNADVGSVDPNIHLEVDNLMLTNLFCRYFFFWKQYTNSICYYCFLLHRIIDNIIKIKLYNTFFYNK